MHVGSHFASTFDTDKTTNGHVFTDLTHQFGTNGFNSGAVQRQRRQCSNVGRVLGRHQLGHLTGECQEIIVLGYEVGFAVDFNHRGQFAVSRQVDTDDPFSGHTGCSLRCLAP